MGYGRYPPHAQRPKQARIALQFVLNYEEGAENSVLHGAMPGLSSFCLRCSTRRAFQSAI